MDQASCKELPNSWFFLKQRTGGSTETRAIHKKKYEDNVERAKKVCSDCAVKQECLTHALDYAEYGIWGGTTEYERTLL